MISKSKNAVGATNVETSNLNHQQIKTNLLGREIETSMSKSKAQYGWVYHQPPETTLFQSHALNRKNVHALVAFYTTKVK